MNRRFRFRHAIPFVAAAALGLFAFASCSQHTDPVDQGNGDVVEIDLVDFAFDDDDVTVEAGTTIRWINRTNTFHTVTPEGHSAWSEWETNSAGQAFEVTLTEPGTYEYYCAPHRAFGMSGRIVVTG